DERKMPLHRTRQERQDTAGPRRVHRLESGRPPEPLVDHRAVLQSEEGIWRVDPPGPERVPPGVELIGKLPLEDRFRYAVPDLLAPIRLDRRTAMVPHES